MTKIYQDGNLFHREYCVGIIVKGINQSFLFYGVRWFLYINFLSPSVGCMWAVRTAPFLISAAFFFSPVISDIKYSAPLQAHIVDE